MKNITKIALPLLALGASAAIIVAQDSGNGNQTPPGSGTRPHRPAPPIIAALDANHDGVIDESEIVNASAALKTLDKNGDGKLTMDELLGPAPKRAGGPGGHRGPPPHEDGQSAPPAEGAE